MNSAISCITNLHSCVVGGICWIDGEIKIAFLCVAMLVFEWGAFITRTTAEHVSIVELFGWIAGLAVPMVHFHRLVGDSLHAIGT